MEEKQIDIQPENSYEIIRGYVVNAQTQIYKAVNTAMVQAYWEIGQEIHKVCG